MSRELSQTFDATLEMLESMLVWVRSCLEKSSLPLAVMKRVELALEEALVNIIQHAYPKRNGAIELSCEIDPNVEIRFTLKDQGAPFNPLLKAPPEPVRSLEEQKEGGLGIFLIRKYMSDVKYARDGDYNVLTLVKKF